MMVDLHYAELFAINWKTAECVFQKLGSVVLFLMMHFREQYVPHVWFKTRQNFKGDLWCVKLAHGEEMVNRIQTFKFLQSLEVEWLLLKTLNS